ncbi:MAG: hydrogenase maturation peptidase HycI [Chloroflexi bacterium]|nr:hydrogenase maturation peptidase HycI [Chloroflexota bacterium]
MTVLVLGVGNSLNGDDGIGPYVATRVAAACSAVGEGAGEKRRPHTVVALDCGTTPENFTAVVRRENPDVLVIVDAASMELAPGEIRVIPPERIGLLTLSTHSIPLSLFITYIEGLASAVKLVGVQPVQMLLGQPLSDVVREAGEALVGLICEGRLDEVALIE